MHPSLPIGFRKAYTLEQQADVLRNGKKAKSELSANTDHLARNAYHCLQKLLVFHAQDIGSALLSAQSYGKPGLEGPGQ
jgi:hypothetical protein